MKKWVVGTVVALALFSGIALAEIQYKIEGVDGIWGFFNVTGIFLGDNMVNATIVQADSFRNGTGSVEWIGPAHILDVDDADIETDLNTYMDVAGDTATGWQNFTTTNNTGGIYGYLHCMSQDCTANITYNGTSIIING